MGGPHRSRPRFWKRASVAGTRCRSRLGAGGAGLYLTGNCALLRAELDMESSTSGDVSEAALAGKVAVVTGASKGIGRAIALSFAAASAE